MTQSTAEIYRQKESSSLTQTAKYIFSKLFSSCEVFELGDLLNDIKTGKTPSKNEKKYYEDEFIDWFKPNEIGDKKYLEKAESKLSKFAYERGQVTVYKANSILINAIGDIGRIAILNHEASSNQQITGIELNEEKLLTEYCYYYLLANRYHFYKDLFQTTLPIVNQKKIKLIPIPVPELHEQKRIVEFLNKLENVKSIEELKDIKGFEDFIEIAEKFYILKEKSSEISTELTYQLDLVKQLRQAFLREAMQGKLVPQDPTDEPASVLLEKIKAEKERLIKEKNPSTGLRARIKKQKPLPPITEDEIPFEIPENWVWCRLGELTTYGSSPKAEPTDLKDNTWVLDLEDIEKETSVLLQKIRFDERNSLSTKSKFEAGDVLYSKLRPYLDKVIVADEAGVCTTEILPLKCYAGFVPEFFRWTLKRPDFIQHVNSLTKGMKMPRLGTKEGELALIPVPPLSEQQRIVAKLDELMRYCDELEASIKESQQQNELLLQQVLREALEPKSIEEKEEELAIAAEPQAKYEKGKVIALKPTNVDYYKRSVLAAEIVWQLHKEPTLGHLKLQKLIYLCQKTGDMQLPTNFLRQAMGPYDNRLMRSIDKQLKQKKWFEYQKDQVFKYQPLEKAGQHHKDFLKYFSEEREDIQFIIDKFKTVKSDIVEIVATLYACLDNMLNEKIIFSEALLLQRFYEWSEEKKKFSDKEVKRVFLSMKDTGIIPRGYNF